MSAFANFFRTLPETLQQPAALAMLGSVGAHLVFFATLPAFTSSTEPRPEAELRRVRLVEPPQGSPGSQTARSQLGLPPVPNTPNSTTQLPIAGSGTSPLPNPLYTIPSLSPLPVPDSPVSPQVAAQNRQAVQQEIDRINRRIAQRQQLLERQQAQANTPLKPPEKSSPITTTQVPGLKPADPAAVANATQNGTNQSAPLPTSTPQTQTALSDLREKQAAMSYNPNGVFQSTTDPAPFAKFFQSVTSRNISVDWSKDYIRVRTLQDPKLEKPLPEFPYPLPMALPNFTQHPIVVAVFVGKDGKPLPNMKPELIGSSGYQILNDKAIELIQQQSNQPNQFPAIDQDRVRVFVYEFQFSAPNSKPVS